MRMFPYSSSSSESSSPVGREGEEEEWRGGSGEKEREDEGREGGKGSEREEGWRQGSGYRSLYMRISYKNSRPTDSHEYQHM